MLDPRKWASREEVLSCFNHNPEEFEVVLALAKVGWAFCQIHAFEGLVQGLILTASKVKVGKPEHYEALDAGGKMLLKHEKLSRSMLGQMTGHLKKAGLSRRDARYLELLVNLRNDFIHRFSHQVPLPGDWERFHFSACDFATYPQYVGKRFEMAQHFFTKILLKSGLLAGQSIRDGMLLWDSNDMPEWDDQNEFPRT